MLEHGIHSIFAFCLQTRAHTHFNGQMLDTLECFSLRKLNVANDKAGRPEHRKFLALASEIYYACAMNSTEPHQICRWNTWLLCYKHISNCFASHAPTLMTFYFMCAIEINRNNEHDDEEMSEKSHTHTTPIRGPLNRLCVGAIKTRAQNSSQIFTHWFR